MSIGTKNFFFKIADSEQNMLDSLIIESVEQYGIDCFYISRTFNNLDNLYGADDSSSYTHAWPLAIYLKNVMGFQGDREFMSKFAGLEIRDQVQFSIPRYTFDQIIASDANFPPLPNSIPYESNRPREGDLIFIPFKHLNKCFKIMWVNLTDMFFQLEKIYTWEITCELFEYSDEVFNTGIPMIDRIQLQRSTNILDYLITDTNGTTPLLLTPSGDYWVSDAYNWARIDPLADNQNLDQESNTYIDWNSSNIDPFTDANNSGGTI
jgi:hypothetical protein